MPGQLFELFDGDDFVVYDADINQGAVVVEQDETGTLTVIMYAAEEDEIQEFNGTLELVHGSLVTLDPMTGDFKLEGDDVVVLDGEGTATFDLRSTTAHDGVVLSYSDDNGVTVCEGDIMPIMCDDVIYGTLSYPGFVRSFVLSEGFENEVVKINPVGEMVMNVTVKK
jgi:hypothetical protein